ncbi:MAG: ATP-grasp domain-containing protein [Alphaproteobacteria bacterium]|nr:ATP-grasp domain-containing protein [Alphaproteobacteria bacterium]
MFYILKSESDEAWMLPHIPAERIFSTDVYNPTRAIADLSVIAEKQKLTFDAILTFDEHLVLQTSVIAQTFGCIATPIATIMHSSSNKLLFRKQYNQHNSKKLLKMPIEILTAEELSKKFPSPKNRVIKPLFGNNSYGVRKISANENTADLATYLKQSWSEKQEECYKNFNETFLLEDYVDGRTFSVDGIVQNGVVHFAGINEFGYGPEPYFFQVSNTIPPDLSENKQSLCYTQIRKLLKKLHYNNTPFHAEIKLNNDKIYVIEIAVRAPGGQIMKGYEQAYGINFVRQVLNLYSGKAVDFKPIKQRYVHQKGVFVYQECNIDNITLAASLPKLSEFVPIMHDGQRNHYPIAAQPVYYYSVAERTPKARTLKADKTEKSIIIRTKPSITGL